MKNLNFDQMSECSGGSNRTCMIYGGLAVIGIGIGFFYPVGFGAAIGMAGAATSYGCFG